MNEYIVCVGGANFDIHSRILHEVVMRDSNISNIYSSSGGVIRNVAENLVNIGNKVILLTAIGKDHFGNAILLDCKEKGIDCSHVYIDSKHSTSVYLDIQGPDGDMCLAANDMKILDYLPEEYFSDNEEVFKNSSLVCIDANLSRKQVESVLNISKKYGKKVFADPVSTVKCHVFDGLFKEIDFLKPNRLELAALTGEETNSIEEIEKASEKLLSFGLKEVAVSLGKEGCYFANSEGEKFYAKAEKVENVISATGAGDSFFAGYVDAKVKGKTPKECIEFAQKCAAKALMNYSNTSK